ncbi:MAG: phosphonopyruvate decarboxylase [Bacteroidales bacterium]|jgi:phosphonopyruvate decarboxylase|nr:phosphonopyruvate decarboxylase [Bacteroidales bacterium]
MINAAKIYELLINSGIDFFTGVPDSLLKDFCAYITDNSTHGNHIIAVNEGAAVGLAAGHHLATSNTSLVYMQNSGIGNATNPLLSLADEKVYKIPMLLMIGWRGEPNVKDEPQHVKQGEVTLSLLEAMKIPYKVIDENESVALEQFKELLSDLNSPVAAVIRKNIFAPYKLKNKVENSFEMTREEALKIVVDTLCINDVVVSTTGKLSRELFEYREKTGAGHRQDFLTVGSMGHSLSIALGVALSKPNRNVYCFDGDGAILMHTGAMATVGTLKPKNLKHIVFNNGSHESVGGQPTVALQINLPQIASACGYKYMQSVSTANELVRELPNLNRANGVALLEIKVNSSSRKDLGRPTRTTYQNKEDFMNNLQK